MIRSVKTAVLGAVMAVAVGGIASAQTSTNPATTREVRDLRRDHRDLVRDRHDVRADGRDLRADKRDVRQDVKSGQFKDARQDLRDVRHDRRDIVGDKHDIRADKRDIRQDRRRIANLPSGGSVQVVSGPVDYSGAQDPGTSVVRTLAPSAFSSGVGTVSVDTST